MVGNLTFANCRLINLNRDTLRSPDCLFSLRKKTLADECMHGGEPYNTRDTVLRYKLQATYRLHSIMGMDKAGRPRRQSQN